MSDNDLHTNNETDSVKGGGLLLLPPDEQEAIYRQAESIREVHLERELEAAKNYTLDLEGRVEAMEEAHDAGQHGYAPVRSGALPKLPTRCVGAPTELLETIS